MYIYSIKVLNLIITLQEKGEMSTRHKYSSFILNLFFMLLAVETLRSWSNSAKAFNKGLSRSVSLHCG